MKIISNSIRNEKSDIKNIYRSLVNDIKKIADCLNGRIRFGKATDGYRGENIAGEFQVVADTGNADTEFTVAHTMDAIPVGFLVIQNSKGGVVYKGASAWTVDNVYLKCSAANAAITVFLLQ